MIGAIVEYTNENGKVIGIIKDKLRVLVVGSSANFDNYLVMCLDGKIELVNPVTIRRIVPVIEAQEEQDKLKK